MEFSFKPDFGLFLLGILNLAYILDQTGKLTLKAPPYNLQQTTISNFTAFSKITNKG